MKTKYRGIRFEQHGWSPGDWICQLNTKDNTYLGAVIYDKQYKRHAFYAGTDHMFSIGRLRDIAAFMSQLKGVKG